MHAARDWLRDFLQDWGPVARILILLAGGLVLERFARKITRRATERIGLREGETLLAARRQRTATLMSFLLSVVRLVIWVTVVFTILGELNVNLAPMLAGAGVLGAALAFGAQNILKDYLAGFFILLENHYTLGDTVKIGAFSGTVEDITMRITLLRGSDGSLQVIPNGTIQGVINQTSTWARVLVDVALPHTVDVDAAIADIEAAARALAEDAQWQKRVLDAPEVPGVVAMTESLVTVRVQVKVKARDQWAVRNELLLRVKRALATKGIEMPRASLAPAAGAPS